MDKKKIIIAKVRRIVKSGGSYYVGLPAEFVKLHGIEKGEQVSVVCGRGHAKVVLLEDS